MSGEPRNFATSSASKKADSSPASKCAARSRAPNESTLKISDVRFRNSVYPGDTITIEVKRKESLGGFTMMSGSVKCGDKRVLSVEFTVAWKTPDGAPTA